MKTLFRTVLAVGLLTSLLVGSATVALAAPTYTMTQVAQHASPTDCWSTVNGKVYNLTSWIAQHPGGPSPIKSMCGKNASAAFNNQHSGTAAAKNMLASFEIGTLAGATTSTSQKITISCKKGTRIKKVTSTKPRCPSGWKITKPKTAKVASTDSAEWPDDMGDD